MRILLVEDDAADALYFKSQLKGEEDLEVEVESCLELGIERATAESFEVVALDLNLPDSSGISTLHSFLQAVPSPPAIVLLTGQEDRKLALEAVQAGAQDYIVKGAIEPPILNQTLRHSYERHQMGQELMAAHERVQFLATHCSLTQLPNRYLFMDRLATAIEAANRSGTRTVVLYLDLNHFKAINDELGHGAGDEVLCTVAARLGTCVRSSDTAARLGGDEFAVLLTGSPDVAALSRLVAKLAASIAEPIPLGERTVVAPPAIGIAVYPDDGSTAESLIRNADAAMYVAKRQGESYRFWAGSLQDSAQEQLDLESDLAIAIRKQEIEAFFQPRVDGATGTITGLEALARWRRRGHDWIPPATFIPVAERTGLIEELGSWMLRNACRVQSRWRGQGIDRGPVAVNISPRQLRNRGFVGVVGEMLRSFDLGGDAIELEITESCLIDDERVAAEALQEFRRLGIRIAIDDFGTGYSNLGRLADLPVDQLKVDRRFVLAAPNSARQAMTTRAIIALGNELDLEVVAEGVETDAQRRFLLSENCKSMQGYFFAKPMPESEIAEFLRAGNVSLPGDS